MRGNGSARTAQRSPFRAENRLKTPRELQCCSSVHSPSALSCSGSAEQLSRCSEVRHALHPSGFRSSPSAFSAGTRLEKGDKRRRLCLLERPPEAAKG
ncbi:hypothetical protein SRHO_G00055530 [Serrasalmus rhombeus]